MWFDYAWQQIWWFITINCGIFFDKIQKNIENGCKWK